MATLNLIKGHNLALKPADAQAEKYLTRVPFGESVVCKVNRPRNPGLHRKFFSLLSLVFENQERYQSFDSFRHEIVMRAGYYEKHVHLTGQVSYVAKSLAYDSMDESEFEELYDKCCDVIIEHFWPEITKADLEDAVLEYQAEYSP
jgi:hypothetical protein